MGTIGPLDGWAYIGSSALVLAKQTAINNNWLIITLKNLLAIGRDTGGRRANFLTWGGYAWL